MTHHIWYHSPCTDGLGAAYAAWAALGDSGIRYTPVAYGNTLPLIEPEDEVTMLDFTAPRADILQLAQVAERITILDHHASAERALSGLTEEALFTEGACEIRVTFDAEHSGAILAWLHFHHGYPAPFALELIEDRDLWRFALAGSRVFHFGIAHLRDFRDLYAACNSRATLDELVMAGRAILRHLEGEWQALATRAGHRPALADMGTIVCPCPPAWFSDLGHLLLDQHPEAQIAILYADNPADGRTTVSLRSRPGGPDVSLIAGGYGGGGHPCAAGYRIGLGAINKSWWFHQ